MNTARHWPFLAALLIIIGATIFFAFRQPRTPATIQLEVPRHITVGQIIDVPLKVSTTEPMNAAEFYFTFSPDLLEVTTVDKGGSFFDLWIKDQPAHDNTAGLLSLAGGLPKPGFSGKSGLVATVRFRAKAPGSGQINLDSVKSRILANDGLGSKIEASFEPISFTIE